MDERSEEAYASAIDAAAFVLLLRERGVRDTALLRAMEQVPREAFAPWHLREHARRDIALPLPCGQTMTAPTTVAAMLIALGVVPGMRVLEIGTGSGYVTALLLRLGASQVRSLERYESLARATREKLGRDFDGAVVENADGLAEGAAKPNAFERILINGLVRGVPRHLSAALAPGGRLVGVLATQEEPRLVTVERAADGTLSQRTGNHLRMCPLTAGRARVL